jgi:hypothetical protein
MKTTELRKLIREEVKKILTEAKAESYPFMSTLEQEKLYDRLATDLEKFISNIATKLEINPSNIRMICSRLGDEGESRNKGLVVQIKANDSKWKGIHGNNFIIQTINDEGVLIDTKEVEIKGSKNKELRDIWNKAIDLEMDDYVSQFNTKLASSLTPEEAKLIHQRTPVIITGK